MRTRRALQTLALVAFLGTAASVQAQQGIITRRVTDSLTREGVAAAQLTVAGTRNGAQANDAGQYVVRGVIPGQVEVRELRIGYVEGTTGSSTLSVGGTTPSRVGDRNA